MQPECLIRKATELFRPVQVPKWQLRSDRNLYCDQMFNECLSALIVKYFAVDVTPV